MKITLEEITQAFRKAKADMWYRNGLNEDDYLKFEESWQENIRSFLIFMDRPFSDVVYKEEWLGGWRLSAKKIFFKENDLEEGRVVYSNPSESSRRDDISQMTYRIMAKPSVNFQILSALWINKVGWKYEKKLGPNVYGNRLRPLKNNKPNLSAHGSFRQYRPMFSNWKKDAINTIKEILKRDRATVMTADIKSFFHCLKPDFLLDDRFLELNDIKLSASDRELTRHLIKAINIWAENTPLGTGLPVGLVVSGVIANLALLDFDRCIESMPDKVFYGRYVDDILIVFRNQGNCNSIDAMWKKIADRSSMFSLLEKDGGTLSHKNNGLEFRPSYWQACTNSAIQFSGDKCRLFVLDRTAGKSFIETLENQINTITSEFRYLPKTIFKQDEIQSRVQRLVGDSGDLADNFRKIDALVLRRGELKEILREMRFLLRNLPVDCWKEQRLLFYNVVKKHLITYAKFAEYAENEFRQVVSLATICGDFQSLSKMISCFNDRINNILKIKNSNIVGPTCNCRNVFSLEKKWRDELFLIYARSIKSSLCSLDTKEYSKAYLKFVKDTEDIFNGGLPLGWLAKNIVSRYTMHDLAVNGLIRCLQWENVRPYGISENIELGIRYDKLENPRKIAKYFPNDYLKKAEELSDYMYASWRSQGEGVSIGVIFPTRPISEYDIPFLGDGRELKNIKEIFRVLRGYELHSIVEGDKLIEEVCHIHGRHYKKVRIALLNLTTDIEMCCDEIKMPSLEKYFERFKSIIASFNSIFKQKNVNYVLLHELALPLRWFLSLAHRCAENGISLISGTTYRVTDKRQKLCKNEAWLSLVSAKGDFLRPIITREEKRVFAHQEAYDLKKSGFSQDLRVPIARPRIFVHGGFAFSTLICSELTDIKNRTRLVGLIDSLFILAWNKDIGSFASIIESTAIELHAYVVQANNNVYGDSRIRAPERDSWRRDVVRIRGGIGEFWVLGEVDVYELRKFQQNWDPNEYFNVLDKKDEKLIKEKCRFKPLPIGYVDCFPNYRRMLK